MNYSLSAGNSSESGICPTITIGDVYAVARNGCVLQCVSCMPLLIPSGCNVLLMCLPVLYVWLRCPKYKVACASLAFSPLRKQNTMS